MKNLILTLVFVFSVFVSFGLAQKQIEPQVQRDPVLEADAQRNLEVATHYFKLKKAYKAVILRFEETFAAYPEFSKMDEFLYMAGMSSWYLSEGKGKQKLLLQNDEEKKKFAPEKLKEDAILYFSMIKERYPTSKYIGETEKNLKKLEGKE